MFQLTPFCQVPSEDGFNDQEFNHVQWTARNDKLCEGLYSRNCIVACTCALTMFIQNDGFGGGNHISDSLLFNSCRESSDHGMYTAVCWAIWRYWQSGTPGPFNSWDRQPYMTEINNGSASLMPAYNQIYRTFMVANYGANGGCIDNDG